MLTCSQCGAPDNPVVEMLPDDNGKIIAHEKHFVRPEIIYLKPEEALTPRQAKQGWFERIFQGRRAIERNECINCLNAKHIRRQLTSELKRKAKALEVEQGAEENFYLLLADVDGAY